MIKIYVPIPVLMTLVFGTIALIYIWRAIKDGTIAKAVRDFLTNIGSAVVGKMPSEIHLEAVASPDWKNRAEMEGLASPLLQLGFTDLGTFRVDLIPGFLLRMLFHDQRHVSAHIYQYSGAITWIEFVTRYNDGSAYSLSTMPGTSIQPPPWLHTIRADASIPAHQLFDRLLIEQRQDGIRPVNASDAIREFEEGYRRIMEWKKSHGMSAQEIAAVALKWTPKKNSAAAGNSQ